MPFGPHPLGLVYFTAVKFAGYSGYAYAVNRTRTVASSPLRKPSAWKVGSVRTAIGVAVGAAIGLGYWNLLRHVAPTWGDYAAVGFFALLLPVRALEWYVVLLLLYEKFNFDKPLKSVVIFWGILVSFALDVVGMQAMLVIPGGAWVC